MSPRRPLPALVRPRLAAAAVGALAVSGLGVLAAPAHAATPAVVLLSQTDHTATLRYDGYDSLVRLAAQVGDPTDTVSFEVNTTSDATDDAAGWTAIDATPTITGDYATLDWDGTSDGASLDGTTVALRVVETGPGGSSTSVRDDVEVADQASVGLGGTQAGYFTQPYADSDETATEVVVHGRTDFAPSLIGVSWWDPGSQDFVGETTTENYPSADKTGSGGIFGAFDAAVDITGFDAQPGAVIAMRAATGIARVSAVSSRSASRAWTTQSRSQLRATRVAREAAAPQATTVHGPDHVQALTLYAQQLASITGGATDNGDGTYAVTLTVNDQDGAPVAGAEVRRTSDGTVVGYTDQDGQVVTTQTGGTSDTYYANSTDVDALQPGIDPSTPVLAYTPAATSTTGVLADGDAFDDDEYADGDVAVQVLDQTGQPYAGATSVDYQLVHGDDPVDPDGYTTATTDDQGRFAVPFDVTGAQGQWRLVTRIDGDTTDAPAVTSFEDGEATLTLDPATDPATADSGTEVDRTATLALADGTPLPGRTVELDYARQGAGGDAGILSDGQVVTHAEATTGADGTVSVVVKDPLAAGRPAESGTLTVATGDTVATGTSTVAGNADTDTDLGVEFTHVVTPPSGPHVARVTLYGQGHWRHADVVSVYSGDRSAGATVKVYELLAHGRKRVVKTLTLDAHGDARHVRIADHDDPSFRTYRARLVGDDAVTGAWSMKVRLR